MLSETYAAAYEQVKAAYAPTPAWVSPDDRIPFVKGCLDRLNWFTHRRIQDLRDALGRDWTTPTLPAPNIAGVLAAAQQSNPREIAFHTRSLITAIDYELRTYGCLLLPNKKTTRRKTNA